MTVVAVQSVLGDTVRWQYPYGQGFMGKIRRLFGRPKPGAPPPPMQPGAGGQGGEPIQREGSETSSLDDLPHDVGRPPDRKD